MLRWLVGFYCVVAALTASCSDEGEPASAPPSAVELAEEADCDSPSPIEYDEGTLLRFGVSQDAVTCTVGDDVLEIYVRAPGDSKARMYSRREGGSRRNIDRALDPVAGGGCSNVAIADGWFIVGTNVSLLRQISERLGEPDPDVSGIAPLQYYPAGCRTP